MNKNLSEEFKKDIEALVKKYEGTGYAVVVDNPQSVFARSEITTMDSGYSIYTHLSLMLKAVEHKIIDHHGFEAPYNKTGTLQ